MLSATSNIEDVVLHFFGEKTFQNKSNKNNKRIVDCIAAVHRLTF